MGDVTGLLVFAMAGHPGLAIAAACMVAALTEGAGMAILGKDQIFAADDIKTETVEVPEWGGQVLVRGLSGHDRDEWEKGLTVRRGKRMEPDMTDFRARLVVLCAVDEKGKRLFHDGDIHQLAGKSGAALDRVYSKAAELSGISEKDVEDLTKDFGPGGGGGSPST
jgi:hypothetical protein